MPKRKSTGIELTYQQRIRFSSSNVLYGIELVLDAILVTLLLYGSIGGLFSACNMIEITPAITIMISFIVLLTMLFFNEKIKNIKIIIIYFILAFFILYIVLSLVLDGGKCFISSYAEHLNHYYGTDFHIEISFDIIEKNAVLSVFQAFIAWAIILCDCLLKKMYKRSSTVLISSILIFSLSFVVGLIPELKYLLAFLMGFIPLAIKIKWKDSILGIQVKVASIICIGLLTFFCAFILPKDVYEANIQSIKAVKQDIRNLRYSSLFESVSYYFSDNSFFQKGGVFGSVGGLNDGVLGEKDKITYDKRTDFIYRGYFPSNTNKLEDYNIYLRSYIGSEYSNKKWNPLGEKEKETYEDISQKWDYCFENLLTDLYRIHMRKNQLDPVENDSWFQKFDIMKKDIGKNHMLLPYGVRNEVLERNGLLYTKESYQKRNYCEQFICSNEYYIERSNLTDWVEHIQYLSSELDVHSIESEYLDVLIEERLAYKEYFEREKDYRRFVYDTYTNVPENVAPRLQEELEEEKFKVLISSIAYIAYDHVYELKYDDTNISEEHVKTIYQIAENCKQFLNDRAHYSLEPGATPDDVDFIDYFLYDNQKGYCSYFATAAVIYLRLCGVPARYVEGYKVLSDQLWKYGEKIETEDDTSFALNITDESAHAWVEVYINGVGWMPIDVTPGFGTVSYDSDSWTTQQEATQNTNSSISSTTLPPTPSIQASQNISKPIETDKNKDTQVKDTNATQISSISTTQKLVLVIVLFILIILISILVRKELLARKCKRLELRQGNNAKTKYYYYQVNRIVRSCCQFGKEQEIREDLQKIQNAFSDMTLDEIAQFINIVEKASFGSKEISDNECVKVKVFYENIRKSLYRNTSFIKKLYYKTWKVY